MSNTRGATGHPFADDDPIDVIITEDFGETLAAYFRREAQTCTSDKELTLKTLKVLKGVFTALLRLRRDGGIRHQDAKLDNMGIHQNKIVLIDYEFSSREGTPCRAANFIGWGGRSRFNEGSDIFDIHTTLEYVFAFCGNRYFSLHLLRTLRQTVLQRHDAPSTARNSEGHSSVYMIDASAAVPCSFEAAIKTIGALIDLA